MSAIAAVIHFTDEPVPPAHIESMVKAMHLRGRDRQQVELLRNAAIGHCLQVTTRASDRETQPLTSPNGTFTLAFDGILDNRAELTSALRQHGLDLAAATDPELVLGAWQVWGRNLLPRLEGDFALLIHDQQSRTTFCARDRTGNRPLHYCWTGTQLLVASTIRGIRAHPLLKDAASCPADRATLAEYLSGQFYSNTATFWEPVKRLPPATAMIVDASGPQLFTWWQPDVTRSIRYRSVSDYAEHYRELLDDTVRRMSTTDFPLAVEASGGLDSSALLACTLQLRDNASLQAPSIRAYGMVFPEDEDADEQHWIAALSRHLDFPVTTLAPARKSPAWYFNEARLNRDFPGYPNGVMNLAVREKAYKDGCRVLLSGWGGDEWLGGSRAYYADLLAVKDWRQLHECLMTDSTECGLPQALYWLVANGLLPLLPYPVRTGLRRLVTSRKKYGIDTLAWLQPDLQVLLQKRKTACVTETPQHVARPGQRSQLNTLRDWHYLQCYEYMERQAADAGIAIRRPYSARQMIEFSLAIPDHIRLHGYTDRYLHRIAFRDRLPEAILQRQDKASFMGTFHFQLVKMANLLTEELPAQHPDWVDHAAVKQMYERYGDPRYRGWPAWLLWLLFGCAAVHA